MFNKFELIGAGVSVFFMAMAIYLVQVESTLFKGGPVAQQAQLVQAEQSGIVVVGHVISSSSPTTSKNCPRKSSRARASRPGETAGRVLFRARPPRPSATLMSHG